MKDFFNCLYDIVSSRIFKILLVLVILVVLIFPQFKKNKSRIDGEQIGNIILKIKEKNKKNVKESGVVKKTIIVEDENKKIESNDKNEDNKVEQVEPEESPEIKNITNVMLKFKMLEDAYQERVKNKKINYRRVSKYGDFVYYESEVLLNSQYAKNPIMHLVVRLEKGDFVSEKLVGKRVGEVATYSQKEMTDAYIDENTEEGRQAKSRLEELDSQNEVMPTTKIIYKVKIVDFVQDETIKKLSLTDNL